jgi:hypothetical protein
LVIRYNRVSDVTGVDPQARPSENPAATPSQNRLQRPHFTWGIYFDNSPRRAHVYGNICLNNVEGGVFLGGGYSEPGECVVENNIFVNSSASQFDVSMGEGARGNRFTRNVVYYDNPQAALLRAARISHSSRRSSNAGLQECDYNDYFLVGGGKLRVAGLPEATLEQWRQRGYDLHTSVADPLFVDPAHGDYRLKSESPALKLGFKPIPFQRIAAGENLPQSE